MYFQLSNHSLHYRFTISDESIPLFCVCVLLGEKEKASVVENCFNKDQSHFYKSVQNKTRPADLNRTRERYTKDIQRVEKLGLNYTCQSVAKALVMNLWMVHHSQLNALHNKKQVLPCKSYLPKPVTNFLAEIIKTFMGIPSSSLSTCTLKDTINILSPSTLTGLYKESDLQCNKDIESDSLACRIVKLKKVVIALQQSFKFHRDPNFFESFYNLVKLTIYLYFGQGDPASGKALVDLEDSFNEHVGYFNSTVLLSGIFLSQDIKLLRTYLICIPSIDYLFVIKGCGKKQMKWQNWKCQTKSAFEQIHSYFQAYYDKAQEHKTKIVLSGRDYDKMLQVERDEDTHRLVEKETFSLLKIVAALKADFKYQLGEGFRGVKNYFTATQGFNSKIAKADIGFISGRLKNYNTSVNELTSSVEKMMTEIINKTLQIGMVQIAENTIKMALRAFQEGNPIGAIVEGPSGVADAMDSLGQLLNSVAEMETAKKLSGALNSTIKITTTIRKGLAKNKVFLSGVKMLIDTVMEEKSESSNNFEKIKLSFLNMYKHYSPGVTKPDIAEAMSYWETVAEEACEIIKNADGAVAGGIKIAFNKNGYCWRVKINITKLAETFSEIYDFQFQLMDALAQYMRSMTSKKAAENIGEQFGDIKDEYKKQSTITKNLQFMAAYSRLMFRLERMKVVEEYCNFLEYTEGGRRPDECSGIKTSVKVLLVRKRKTCIRETSGYINIPTKPAKQHDKAFVNLTELIANRTVSLKIPNEKWLLSQRPSWIGPDDKRHKIYLQSLAIILPVVSKSVRKVAVTTEFSGGNRLTPTSDIDYVIIPKEEFRYLYSEGPQTGCAPGATKLDNPYELCPDKAPLQTVICQLGSYENDPTRAYPSVFTEMKIRIDGYQNEAILTPVTDLPIKAFFNYCVISSGDQSQATCMEDTNASKLKDMCCESGKYFSSKQSSCLPCPSGSTSQLNGYYCGRD